MRCNGIFDHSIGKLETIKITKYEIVKMCKKCGYVMSLPRSSRVILFPSNLLMQKKKWASDDNRKELLQPLTQKGEVNEDFTEAFGFNPFDSRTKAFVPRVQKGVSHDNSGVDQGQAA